MTPTDAIYGFAAWLTTRPGELVVGETHDAAPMAALAKEWCEANSLPDVSPEYPGNLVYP